MENKYYKIAIIITRISDDWHHDEVMAQAAKLFLGNIKYAKKVGQLENSKSFYLAAKNIVLDHITIGFGHNMPIVVEKVNNRLVDIITGEEISFPDVIFACGELSAVEVANLLRHLKKDDLVEYSGAVQELLDQIKNRQIWARDTEQRKKEEEQEAQQFITEFKARLRKQNKSL